MNDVHLNSSQNCSGLKLPKAILFDLDGTLLDSAPDLVAAANLLRTRRNLPPLPYEILRPQASKGARGLVGTAFGINTEDTRYAGLRDEFLQTYEAAMTVHSRLFAGVTVMLEGLKEHGIVWGIVTNKLARFSNVLVPQVGLATTACLVSGDTTAYAKPHPAPLLFAAQTLQLNAEDCWYVGDDERDIQAGRAAGMRTLAASWGYCQAEEVKHWQADWILQQVDELLPLLIAIRNAN